jgi:hypothetical protein
MTSIMSALVMNLCRPYQRKWMAVGCVIGIALIFGLCGCGKKAPPLPSAAMQQASVHAILLSAYQGDGFPQPTGWMPER